MSAVHDEIAMAALSVQPKDIQLKFKDYITEFKASSWYPDEFADSSMSQEKKDAIDLEADRFIYPPPPETELQQKLAELAENASQYSGASPLKSVYLISFYLKNAVESLHDGDIKSAVKFCGVYSHVIADTCEPIHAVNPSIIDIVVPPPKKFLGLELHANVEGLKAPVDIDTYIPKLLGSNLSQAEMGAFSGLIASHSFGAALTVPIVQALYADDRDKAVALSSKAQSESARHFADFIFTVFSIASGTVEQTAHICDLRNFPYISNNIDMLYRYQPISDYSLVPYSGGKMHPLSLLKEEDKIINIKGLGVVPSLAPPFRDDNIRNADIEYLLVPGAYKEFSAQIGLNPLFKESMPTVEFKVIGDGKVLAESGEIKPGTPGKTISAELDHTQFLTLRMSYYHTPSSDELNKTADHLGWVSHGVWGEPKLL